MKVVIDTNVLVSALSRKSQYHWIIQQIPDEKFDLHITSEILLEYEEILIRKYSHTVANNFIASLKELPNVFQTIAMTPFLRWEKTISLKHEQDMLQSLFISICHFQQEQHYRSNRNHQMAGQ